MLLGDDALAIAVIVFAAAIFLATGGDDNHAMLHLAVLTVAMQGRGEVAFEAARVNQRGIQVDVDQGVLLNLVNDFSQIFAWRPR